MSPGQPDSVIVRRHLLALDAAVQRLRRHAGEPLTALVADTDSLWAIERGLQLCAQNTLDISGLDDFVAFGQHVESYLIRINA
jgi:hypothetical protein